MTTYRKDLCSKHYFDISVKKAYRINFCLHVLARKYQKKNLPFIIFSYVSRLYTVSVLGIITISNIVVESSQGILSHSKISNVQLTYCRS
jgi:hypothetical protein